MSTDEKLAMQFFNNKEYDKALVFFEKLYDENPYGNYSNYYKCLLKVKDTKKAEKVVKKQMKANPQVLQLYIDLAVVYREDGDLKKENEQYEKAIKEVGGDVNQVITLGRAFVQAGKYDQAITTYMKGRKMMSENYPFFYEVADVYKEKGDLKSMINEYLDAIEFRENELMAVQAQLQNNLGYDDEKGGLNNPILKQELLKRIQSQPDRTIFSEFLYWILLQQKDFDASFTHAKALDKRKKEEGARLIDLGKICMGNENYEVAIKCFDYVRAKGKDNIYYDLAYIESTNAQYEKIIKQRTYTTQEIIELENKLITTTELFGKSQLTVSIIRKHAHIKTYFQQDSPKAIDILNDAILIPALEKSSVAELKLDLGDILLISGEMWEASLLFSQVEKAFKYETIGQEAKFRNAKVSYYAGDFKWSKAQLDVLKGATTKLMANDAMDLSMVISDAIGVDTNVVPLMMFSQAELLILQHQTTRGMKMLDSINILFEEHSLADDIYFKKAAVYLQIGDFKSAIESYKRVADVYGDEIFGDDATFKLAEIYHYYLNDVENAKLYYQEILTKFPSSIFSVEARKRYRKLRGDTLN